MTAVLVLPSRSRFGARNGVRALALAAGAAAATGLLVFHARLLWLRASGGSILDSSVGLRWVSSALLLGAVLALRRRALSLPNGRNALVFWLLVAVLHWNAGSPETRAVASNSESAVETLFLLPAAGAGFVVGAGLVLVSVRRARPATRFTRYLKLAFAPAPILHDGWGLILAPRPPPA